MSEPKLIFRVMVEELFPTYAPSYKYGKKRDDSSWWEDIQWFPDLRKLAGRMAEHIAGTKSHYLIIDQPLDEFFTEEGIQGYSENSNSSSIVRRLNEQEKRVLLGNINLEIAKHKQLHNSEVD